MAVVIDYSDSRGIREKKNKKRRKLDFINHSGMSLRSHFFLYLLSFLLGFLGTVFVRQFPNFDIGSVLLPVPKNIVSNYITYDISFGDTLSTEEIVKIKESLSVMELDETPRFRFTQDSNLKIKYAKFRENSIYSSFLLPVGHKYWIKRDLKKSDVKDREIIVTKGSAQRVQSILSGVYGSVSYNILEVEDVIATLATKDENKSVGLVTFEELNPQLQLLKFNGKYFLDSKGEGAIRFSVDIVGELPDNIRRAVSKNTAGLKNSTFVGENILKVNMTGVTAITRGLINVINSSKDNGYPAKKIGSFLADADLTHTSNEVSFVEGCNYTAGLRFCSKPEYMQTLKDSGVDIIELTGNHNNDYGANTNANSIEIYKKEGMEYFGGGLNSVDASKPLVKNLKGSMVAFLGYNYYDTILGTGALAGVSRAGANSFSFDKMDNDIKEAKKISDIVIVTFQFQECYSYPPSDVIYPICYRPLSTPDQVGVFRRAVDYGADIVVGTQAHQPQTYEIYNGKVIYYGLGNLYFDQINWIGTRQGLILTHYIYEGKLLQTKITTTLYDNTMQPYVTEGKDRELLLNLLKQAR